MTTKEIVAIRVEKDGANARVLVETLPRMGASAEFVKNLEVTAKSIIVDDPDGLAIHKEYGDSKPDEGKDE